MTNLSTPRLRKLVSGDNPRSANCYNLPEAGILQDRRKKNHALKNAPSRGCLTLRRPIYITSLGEAAHEEDCSTTQKHEEAWELWRSHRSLQHPRKEVNDFSGEVMLHSFLLKQKSEAWGREEGSDEDLLFSRMFFGVHLGEVSWPAHTHPECHTHIVLLPGGKSATKEKNHIFLLVISWLPSAYTTRSKERLFSKNHKV